MSYFPNEYRTNQIKHDAPWIQPTFWVILICHPALIRKLLNTFQNRLPRLLFSTQNCSHIIDLLGINVLNQKSIVSSREYHCMLKSNFPHITYTFLLQVSAKPVFLSVLPNNLSKIRPHNYPFSYFVSEHKRKWLVIETKSKGANMESFKKTFCSGI